MGHGIFPNYGLNYVKTWMSVLSKKERKEVFFTSNIEKSRLARLEKEENMQASNKFKNNK